MDKYKNAIIAVLAGLLALTLSTPNAQSATSTTAKAIEYDQCITNYGFTMGVGSGTCLKYRP